MSQRSDELRPLVTVLGNLCAKRSFPAYGFEAPIPGADFSYARLRSEIALVPEVVAAGGESVTTNRTVAWYGDDGALYRYAGSTNVPQGWTPELARMREHVQNALGVSLNSCLVGRYDDGRNDVEWHADDEPELRGCIVSVSLGATRTFKLRPSAGGEHIDLALEHGSVLVMAVESQQAWQHAVPPEPVARPRMNLTFHDVRID